MNKRLFSLFLFALLFAVSGTAKTQKNIRVTSLKIEGMSTGYNQSVSSADGLLGLDTPSPRFSWQTESSLRNVVQTGYHILVASSPERLAANEGDLWDTGMVLSRAQLWIPYQGKSLHSNQRCWWKVMVITNQGDTSWSEPQLFGVGLLNESRWSGRWIGLESLQPGESRGLHTRMAARYLRKVFKLKGQVKCATAYVAGLGLHQLYVNGQQIGSQVLSPIPSDYRKTIYYNTYDVTHQFTDSSVAVGVILGNGRYFPMRQNKPYKIPVFGLPKCRVDIIVEYTNGKTDHLSSDESWKITTDGPIRANNEYDGEEYDARREMPGWATVYFNDANWKKAERTDIPTGTLHGLVTPGMTVVKQLKPVKITNHIIDFGQNTAGWVRMKVSGQAGDTIRLRYAERLVDGKLYTDNLRDALSEDIYVCNGTEQGREWHALFSYHGFRYVEVSCNRLQNKTDIRTDSSDLPIKKEDFLADVISDTMTVTGQFTCSDTILNQVYQNAVWGIRSNYKGMPVDCPQRNERQPWLGDRTVGSLGESFAFDNSTLYAKWMRDICESQRSDGNIPDVAPAFWNYYSDDVTWPAALPFTCDMLYEQFADCQPIIESYSTIKKWMNHILDEYTSDGIITRDKYGDWCVPPEKLELIHSQDSARITDGSLISTAYGIRVMQLLEKFARLQQISDDAARWHSLAATMTKAFNQHFLTLRFGTSPVPGHPLYPDSVYYGNNTATANLLPLAFGLVPDSCRQAVVKNIVTNIITKGDGHVTCGVIGISWLLRQLSDQGYADVAYLLATNSTYPSWGYMAQNGATTIWELWNGDKASPKMNSGNHVMLLGDLLTWCYQYLGGIRQDTVGYQHLVFRPSFEIEDCSHADVSFLSPYGWVKSNWQKSLQHLSWDVTVPCNVTADVCLPDGTVAHVGSGSYHYDIKIPTRDSAIIKDEFLYEQTTFPQCHASTITQLKNGDLVAAYFGGTKEGHPDVCIWVNRKPKGAKTWSQPILAADGVFNVNEPDAVPGIGGLTGINDSTTDASAGPIIWKNHPRSKNPLTQLKRKPCYNPVLYQMPDGELLLFFKIGSKVADWTGWLVRSKDGGKTWSNREKLPQGFLGPIKNKPELIDGRLICPSSTEKDGWHIHFEIYDLATKQWKYVGPISSEQEYATSDMLKSDAKKRDILCIQPSILQLKDGRLQVLCRTRNGRLATSYSSDKGDTWSKVTLTDLPNNNSGTDAVTLRDGRHALIYNDFASLPGTPKGVRTPISIALSDDGIHWHHALTLEDSPISQYSYPAIIQGQNGHLYCTYTWRRQRISFKEIDLDKIDIDKLK